MRDDIDRALILVQDTRIRSRSEFIRAACQLALDSLAKDCGPRRSNHSWTRGSKADSTTFSLPSRKRFCQGSGVGGRLIVKCPGLIGVFRNQPCRGHASEDGMT